MHQPSGIYSLQTAKDMPNLNKIQNYAARWVHHDYSHCTSGRLPPTNSTTLASTFGPYLGPLLQNFSSEHCYPQPTLLTNTPQNCTLHLSNVSDDSYRYRKMG